MAYPAYQPPVGGVKLSHLELTDHCRPGGEATSSGARTSPASRVPFGAAGWWAVWRRRGRCGWSRTRWPGSGAA